MRDVIQPSGRRGPVWPRRIGWSFVSSSKERIERAGRAWKEGGFPKIPGDEEEFIPLPESV